MPVKASIAVVFFGLVLLVTFLVHWRLRKARPGRSLATLLTSAAVFDLLSHGLAFALAPSTEAVVRALPMSLPLLLMWGIGLVVLMDIVLRMREKRAGG
ncbi:MAG: hypothetical protein AB2A00_35800 [Myxococcota bacterium]